MHLYCAINLKVLVWGTKTNLAGGQTCQIGSVFFGFVFVCLFRCFLFCCFFLVVIMTLETRILKKYFPKIYKYFQTFSAKIFRFWSKKFDFTRFIITVLIKRNSKYYHCAFQKYKICTKNKTM